MDVPKGVQDKLAQFQNMQNQLQMVSMQKQQLMLQKTDLENAKKELEKTEDAKVYRMIGPILIQTEREKAIKDIGDEGDSASAKTKVLETQEKKLVDKLNSMRGEIQNMITPQAKT